MQKGINYILNQLNHWRPSHRKYFISENLFSQLFTQIRNLFANDGIQPICCKMFYPKSMQIFKIIHCDDCSFQINSVICMECYKDNPRKHDGHKITVIEIVEGCCDCGDDNKLKRQGFCNKHTIDEASLKGEDAYQQIDKQKFKKCVKQNLQLLHYLYVIYLSAKNDNTKLQQQRQQILSKVDSFGFYFINAIYQIVRTNYCARTLLTKLLYQGIETFESTQPKQIKFLFLHFEQLPETSQKCTELYYQLFYNNQQLRKDIIIQFLQCYSKNLQFVKSKYSSMCLQLFSNTKVIKQLKQYIDPLILPYGQMQLSKQNKFQDFQQYYKIYKLNYQNLQWLKMLKEQSLQIYWKQMINPKQACTKKYFFQMMSSYQQQWNQKDILQLINRKYYGIQIKYIELIINIIRIMQKDQIFIEELLKRLFNYIIKFQENKLNNNLFFSRERAFTLFLLAFFFHPQSQINQIDSITIEHVSRLKQVLANTRSDKQFDGIMKKLFQHCLNYFRKVIQVYKNVQTINKHLDFHTKYFKSQTLLFSIDAVLYKLLKKILSTSQQGKDFVLNTELNIINQMKRDIDQITLDDLKNQNSFKLSKDKFNIFINFTSLLNQISNSDLCELSIGCKIPSLRQKQYHSYLKIYQECLFSLKIHQISFKYFKELASFLYFFDKQQLIKINSKWEPDDTIKTKKPINLKYYFSLKYKLKQNNIKDKFDTVSFTNKPLCFASRSNPNADISTMTQIDGLIKIIQICQQISNPNIAVLLVEDCLQQIVKIFYIYSRQSFYIQFLKKYYDSKINQKLPKISQFMQLQLFKITNNQNILNNSQCSSSNSQFYIDSYSYYQQPQNKIQNIPNSQEVNFVDLNIKCAYCHQSQFSKSIHQYCYVRWNNLNNLFQLQSYRKIAIFTTCGHYYHKECHQKQLKKINNYTKTCCLVCHEPYNIQLSQDFQTSPSSLGQFQQNINDVSLIQIVNESSLDQSLIQINDELVISQQPNQKEEVTKQINSLKKVFQDQSMFQPIQQMQKSLIAIIIYCALYNNEECIKRFLPLYRNIFNKLFKQNKLEISKFTQTLNAKVTQLIQIKLKIKNCNQFLITQIFDYFKGNLKKFKINNTLPNQFKFIELPNNLTQLSSHQDQQQCCKSPLKLWIWKCLSCSNNRTFQCCLSCYKINIKNHILQHHLNECLCIQTSKGCVYSFKLLKQGKLTSSHEGQLTQKFKCYIYVDSLLDGYTYNQHNFPKQNYKLNKKVYRQLEKNYFCLQPL